MLVVYESLEHERRIIAYHSDITDVTQTVTVNSRTSGGGAKTGRNGLPSWLLVVGISATVGSVLLIYLRKKRFAEP